MLMTVNYNDCIQAELMQLLLVIYLIHVINVGYLINGINVAILPHF